QRRQYALRRVAGAERERGGAVVADHVAEDGEVASHGALEREQLVAEKRATGEHQDHGAGEHGDERELVAEPQVDEGRHGVVGLSETSRASANSFADSRSPVFSAWTRLTSKCTWSPWDVKPTIPPCVANPGASLTVSTGVASTAASTSFMRGTSVAATYSIWLPFASCGRRANRTNTGRPFTDLLDSTP